MQPGPHDPFADDEFASMVMPSGYEYVRDLGSGSFGEVVAARDPSGGLVAIKRAFSAALDLGADHRLADDCAGEAAALQAIVHPHVVRLLRSIPQADGELLVLELCATDLERVLAASKRPLAPAAAQSIFVQLAQAVAACHRAGVMHRDVKPGNVLLCQDGTTRLADFGHARWLVNTQPCSPAVASRWYRAPELLYGGRCYTQAVDVWALGCVLAELLGVGPLFPGCSDIDQLCQLRKVLGSIELAAWPAAQQLPDFHKISFPPVAALPLQSVLPSAPPAALLLLGRMLQYNPERRPTADEVLEHEYCRGAGSSCAAVASLLEDRQQVKKQTSTAVRVAVRAGLESPW